VAENLGPQRRPCERASTVLRFPALGLRFRKVDVRLPGKGGSNPHGARPVHLITTMIKWTRTSRLSIKNSLSSVSTFERTFSESGSCGFWRHPQRLVSEGFGFGFWVWVLGFGIPRGGLRGFRRDVQRFRGGLVFKAH